MIIGIINKKFTKERYAIKINREKYGIIASVSGLLSNILLFTIKIIIGLTVNSIAICADAVNNLADSGSSIITLIGFKMAEKPADAEHPYGHARIEYIAGLIVSFIVTLIGGQLLITSVKKILTPEPSQYNLLTVVILVIAVIIKLLQYFFYKRIAGIINSVSLKASSIDSLTDSAATFVVFIGLLIGKLTGFNIDGYLGTAVSLFIIYSGLMLIIQTANPLLGNPPDKKLVETITDKILSYDGVVDMHDLILHSYGPGICFATAHVEVSAESDILEMHDLIDNIEIDILNDMGIHLVIHLDPIVLNDERVNQLREQVSSIIEEMSPDISIHDFRVAFGITHNTVLFDITVPPKYKIKDRDLCRQISDQIKILNPANNTVITVDRNYSQTVNKS